jgi:acetyl esterase/lipase
MSRDVLGRTPPVADRRIAYGRGPAQFGDLRLPHSPGPHPLVIFLHGGWWRSAFDLEYAGHLSAALTAEGIATWNLEYRRTGGTGGGWPATFQDAAAGADYVRVLAETIPIDLGRVAAMGHSAGGHLALWLAGRHRIPADSPLHGPPQVSLCGVIALAGAVDLRIASRIRLGESSDHAPAVHELMGGAPDEFPERYRAGSPGDLLPLGVRQILVHGTADDRVPYVLASSYTEHARECGDDARLVGIDGAGHFDPVDPESSAFEPVRDAARDLFAR